MRSAARQVTVLLAIALVPALLCSAWHPHRPAWAQLYSDSISALSLSQIKTSSEGILWVDARSSADFVQSHIPGALFLNMDEWEAQLPELIGLWSPDAKVVVYGDGSPSDASLPTARRLARELSSSQIFTLRGGWPAWRQSHP